MVLSGLTSCLIEGWRWSREAIDQLVFEPRCLHCEMPIAHGLLCPACEDLILRASDRPCPRCAMPVGPWASADHLGCSECRGRPLGFDRALALGPYHGPLRRICLQMKQERGEPIARKMAQLLLAKHREELHALGIETVLPVPLHWFRRIRRGYNQAETLAREIARGLKVVHLHGLRRVRDTRPLARLGHKARAEELKGAFALRPGALTQLRGRSVLLVDDILTTGATCGESARLLKKAGARQVIVAVVGRAEGLT